MLVQYSAKVRFTLCEGIYSIWVGCEIQSPDGQNVQSTKIKILSIPWL